MIRQDKLLKIAGALSLAFVVAGCAGRPVKPQELDPRQCWNDQCLTGQMARTLSQLRNSKGLPDEGFVAVAVEMIRNADPKAQEVITDYLVNESSPAQMQNLLKLYMQGDEQTREQIVSIINARDITPEMLEILDKRAARSMDLQCDVQEGSGGAATSPAASSLAISCRSR